MVFCLERKSAGDRLCKKCSGCLCISVQIMNVPYVYNRLRRGAVDSILLCISTIRSYIQILGGLDKSYPIYVRGGCTLVLNNARVLQR